MADKWLISRSPEGVETWFHGAENGKYTIETVSPDVAPTTDRNKALYNENAGKRWGDMKHVASIPLTVYWDLVQKGVTRDQKDFSKWLNDPDNRHFRTFPGKV